MRAINFKLEDESDEEQRAAGRYNPAQVAIYRGPSGKLNRSTLGAGSGDSIYAFRDGNDTYFLAINSGLPYVGMESFIEEDAFEDPTRTAQVGEVFFQGSEQVEEALGPRGVDLSPLTIAKYLMQYINSGKNPREEGSSNPAIPAGRKLLRTVRFSPYRKGAGPTFTLNTWTAYQTGHHGKTMIGYRLTSSDKGVIFEGEDFGASPMHSIDGDETVESIMGFLTLRPGDTDAEYFRDYTPKQTEFMEQHAEALSGEVYSRFGEGRRGSNPEEESEDPEEEFDLNAEMESGGVIQDTRGGKYSVSYDGRYLGEAKSMDAAIKLLAQTSEDNKYWPNYFYVNDHGNVEQLVLKPRIVKGRVISVESKYVRGWV